MSQDTADADGTLLVPIANPETADRQLGTAIDVAADRSYRMLLVFVLEVPAQLSLVDGRRYLLEDEHEAMLADAVERVESHGIPADQRIRMARGVATGTRTEPISSGRGVLIRWTSTSQGASSRTLST